MAGFVTNNVFDSFRHGNSYADYGVDKAYLNRIREQNINNNNSNNDKQKQPLALVPSNITDNFDEAIDTVITPNQNKHQRAKTIGIIGASTLVVGALTMVLTKGKLTKSVTGLLGKIVNNASEKIATIKQKPTISKYEGYYLSYLQKVNKLAMRARGAIFNLTPVKDVLFERFLREKCGLKKPCDAVTNGFRDLSFSTVKNTYGKADGNIREMSILFDKANKRIASGEFKGVKPVPTVTDMEKLSENSKLIRKEFINSFSQEQVNKRNEALVDRFKGLGSRVYNAVYGKIKDFVSDVDSWTSFVSERLVARDKEQIMDSLMAKKRVITNNPKDNYKLMDSILSKLENTINPQNEKSRSIVKSIRALTDDYLILSGPEEKKTRAEIVQNINKYLHSAMNMKEGYTPEQTKKINSLVRKFGKIINTDKKGAVEELLTLYKEYLPKEEYLELKKSADKAVKSLNRAVVREGSEYVDKVRDLSVGSALTDVAMGMALPLGTSAIAMASAKTKEKKRSVALKYGLPLVAGVATSMLCTIRLISGGRALLLGGAVTVIGNEIFEKIDNYLIARDKKRAQVQQKTESTPVNI